MSELDATGALPVYVEVTNTLAATHVTGIQRHTRELWPACPDPVTAARSRSRRSCGSRRTGSTDR